MDLTGENLWFYHVNRHRHGETTINDDKQEERILKPEKLKT